MKKAFTKLLKLKVRTKFCILSFVLLTLYTTIVLIMNYKGIEVSDTLTEHVFKALTVELALLAGIKIADRSE